MRHQGLYRFFAVLLLWAISMSASAGPLACGVFRSADPTYSQSLILQNAQVLQTAYGDTVADSRLYQQRNTTLYTLHAETGLVQSYLIQGNRLVEVDDTGTPGTEYTRISTLPCGEPPALPPAGECRRDLAACGEWSVTETNAARLRRVCEEGLAFGCSRYLSEVARAERPIAEPPEAVKALCDDKSPRFDAKACENAIAGYVGQMLAQSMSDVFGPEKPLPAAVLDGLPELCIRSRSAAGCRDIADALLTGGRIGPWLTTLGNACGIDGSDASCARLPRTRALLANAKSFTPIKSMPCGLYAATDKDSVLYSEWLFKDKGRVQVLGASDLSARLDDGAIKIRHDKGGDFVLRQAGDVLIGTDTYTMGNVYIAAEGSTRSCAAPIAYREAQLAMDCPRFTPEDTTACCAAGKLQGCNTRGNQLALTGDWAGAANNYVKLCEANIRVGCENLARASMEVDTEHPEVRMAAICKKDPRAVACDVLETTAWVDAGLMKAFQEILRDTKKEDAEE